MISIRTITHYNRLFQLNARSVLARLAYLLVLYAAQADLAKQLLSERTHLHLTKFATDDFARFLHASTLQLLLQV